MSRKRKSPPQGDTPPSDNQREKQSKTKEAALIDPGHTGAVDAVSVSQNGKLVASGSWDKTVRIWNAKTGVCLHKFNVGGCVADISLSPCGNYVAVANRWEEHGVSIWDIKTGTQLRKLKTSKHFGVTSVSYSWDGKRLVSASPSGTVYIWDGDTFQNHFCLEGLSYYIGSSIFAAEFSPDGHRVAGGSGFDSIWIWDAHTGKFLRELEGPSGCIISVAFSPVKGDNRLVSASRDNAVRIWDAHTGKFMRELRGHSGRVSSVAFSPDGKLVMCGCSALVIYDAETGNMKQELKGHMGSVHSVACSLVKDPIRLVSGSWDHTVRIWEGPRLSFIENTLKETSACTAALIKLIVEYDGKEFDNVLCMGRVRRRERIDLPPILG